jgi:Stress responsive A/B Barrel Domain
MLTHIVIWKYRPEVPLAQREEHRQRLQALPNLVAADIHSFQVGADILQLPRSYDTGLVAIFADRAALDRYTVHPEHVAVANLGREIAAHVASVDFEN